MLIVRCLYATLRFLYAWSAALLIVGGLCALILLIHRKVYHHLLHDGQYQVVPGPLVVVHKPEWVGDGIVRALRGAYPYRESISIFENGLTENIGKVYGGHPWVERVRFVKKEFPNRIQIAVDLRRPVAAVEFRGRYYLVDRHSVRLPGEFERLPALPFLLPPVVGVKNAPPREGVVWESGDVRAGVSVARALQEHGLPAGVPLMAIDVENADGRRSPRESEIVLWMGDMVPVEFGRSPASDPFGELTVERKLKNLRLVLLACPELRGVARARIQYDHPTFEDAR